MKFIFAFKISQCAFIFIIAFFLASCSAMIDRPDTMADVNTAYPDEGSMAPPANNANTFERATMPAPHSVVFRAVQKAALDEDLRLNSIDKERGVILATLISSSEEPPTSAGLGYTERRYFFAIRVIEKGRKRTEVVIMAKAHGACQYGNPTGAWNAAVFGALTPFMLMDKEKCEAYSKVHWTDSFDHNKALLSRMMSSIRSNLFAAGYE